MVLDELKLEYAKQDNLATAWPIYFTVQVLEPVGVIAEGYSPIGDGETRYEHNCEDCYSESCRRRSEDGEIDKCPEDKDVQVGYLWIDREFFLTRNGAEEYRRANKHNLGETRIYCKHFDRRNFEMNTLLKELGFKVDG